MRLVTRQIHRAFPELDPFDDERCRRFVSAARRSWWGRLTDLLACLLACLCTGGLASAAAILLPRWLTAPRWGIEPYWSLQTTLLVSACVLSPVAALVTRDLALRLRIRHVLRTRGLCFHCRYSLLGLPVAANRTVTCPECRSVCDIDESMTHLATGTVMEVDAPAPSPRESRARSRRRVLVRRVIPALLLLAAGLIGLREYFLVNQAAAAMRLLTGAGPLVAWAESLQPYRPDPNPAAPDAWTLFDAASMNKDLLERQQLDASAPKDSRGKPLRPRYASLLEPNAGTVLDGTNMVNPQATEEARRRMTLFRAAGLFADFDRIADANHAVRTPSLPPGIAGAPATMLNDPDIGRIRETSMILAVRLRDAILGGDRAETIASFRTLLALSRMSLSQTTIMQHLYGLRTAGLAYGTMRSGLVAHPESFDAATLRSLAAAMREQAFVPRIGYPWKGYELVNEMSVAWFFAQPSVVRFGKFTPRLQELLNGPGGAPYAAALDMGPLGTLDNTLAELQARSDATERWATDPPWMRGAAPKPASPSHLLVSEVTQDGQVMVPAFDRWRLDTDGLLMQLAIEHWIRERGVPPTTIFEAAELLELQVPKDPFRSSGPLMYRVLSAEDRAKPEHAMHRGYLLYSAGADTHDDGGVSPPRPFDRGALLESATYRAATFDYVFNESDESESH